jgi:hypothetical protein
MLKGVTTGTNWVNVDGARFRQDTGEWEASPRTEDGRVPASHLEEGLVSVDGASFDLIRGGWVAAPPRVSAEASQSTIPAGFVSVDGALLRVEPS